MTKTIGIIGGMGPLATADLFRKIILLTEADCDQKHLHIVVDNNTNIPDRTAAILNGGVSPMPELTRSAERLKRADADFCIIPCNTAHYFHAALSEVSPLPILNMLDETADALKRAGVRRAGLLATQGTLKTGLYQQRLSSRGIESVVPDEAQQELLMKLIYDDIKGGRVRVSVAEMKELLDEMISRGAETFVLGCTELPIAFERDDYGVPTVDPTAELAKAAIRTAGGRVKGE